MVASYVEEPLVPEASCPEDIQHRSITGITHRMTPLVRGSTRGGGMVRPVFVACLFLILRPRPIPGLRRFGHYDVISLLLGGARAPVRKRIPGQPVNFNARSMHDQCDPASSGSLPIEK